VPIEGPSLFNLQFALACSCGGNQHFVHGYRWSDPEYASTPLLISPIELECARCEKQTPWLDTDVHGFDVELGGIATNVRGQGHRGVYECNICGRQPLELVARFEYSDDLLKGDCREYEGRQQDLFGWFSLLGMCPLCLQMLRVADFECD
jgi:hypothetical protein